MEKEKGRPKVLDGQTYALKTGCGKLYITINSNGDKRPIEVMAKMGKTGGCVASQIEGLARLLSVSLQNGVPAETLIGHLRGIRCSSIHEDGTVKISSCSDAFAKAMDLFIHPNIEPSAIENGTPRCPQCGSKMNKVNNLLVCDNCAFEKAD